MASSVDFLISESEIIIGKNIVKIIFNGSEIRKAVIGGSISAV